MNNRMTARQRIITGICTLALAAVIILPIWRIELSAPQYPEGLVLKIYASRLGGDVDVVNGLNHYIGMRTLHAKDFVEFSVLPYIIGIFVLFGLLSVIINRRWFFFTWTGFFVLFAGTAIIDFYRWEYNYGHNLDPTAPIQVPGMTYQPPLIGYKQLLNFGAFSIPDTGGWIFIGIGLVLVTMAFLEIRKMKRSHKNVSLKMAAVIIPCLVLLNSCSSGPQPVQVGTDACDFCRMTIMDNRFGGELLTKKGKPYKFDDIHCLVSFLKSNTVPENERGEVYLFNYYQPGQFLKAPESLLFTSDELHSPMGGNTIAVAGEEDLKNVESQFKGKPVRWEELIQ